MKRLSVYFIAAFLSALLLWLAGCETTPPNPEQPLPTYWTGTPLTQADITGATPSINIGGSPYVVDDDLVIEEGVTLTIDAGVVLMFKDSLIIPWLKVEGKLVAEGDANDPIRFTTAHRNPDYGQWRGLAFSNETEQSLVRYCIFEFGAYFDLDTVSERGKDAQFYPAMIAIRNSSPIIENNIIYHNQNNGVFVTGANSYPEVRYNIIVDNDASALRSDSTTAWHFFPEYNCGAENSSLDFLMWSDSLFGRKRTVNANLDSTDSYYNFTIPPLFVDMENGDFHLQSCSPCVDAGPEGVSGPGADIGRIDFGVYPYSRTATELRGVQTGTLEAGATYQMSCHVRVPPGETLTIPAGTIINIAGFFNFEVFGTLLIEGTAGNRVQLRSSSAEPGKGDWGVFVLFQDTLQAQPSSISYADFDYFDYMEIYQAGVRFDYCTFKQSRHSGVRVISGSDDGSAPVTFDHCHFDNLGLFAVQAEQSTVIIQNSLIENCIGEAVVLIGESPVENETSKLTNNIIRNCAVTGLVCQNFASPQVINNVITLVGYGGIDCINNSSPMVLNNIISACGRPGIMVRNSSFPIIDYNDVWQNNTAADSTLNYQGTAAGPNDISADPQFTGDNNELGSGSACIDAGHIGAEFNDSDGSQNNIGAYGGPNGGTIGP